MRAPAVKTATAMPLIAAFTVAALWGGQVRAELPPSQRYALLIGVNRYSPPFQDLEFCHNDMERLKERLLAAGFPQENIILPSFSHRVDYECELGVVIGKAAAGVAGEKAKDYILGYTCFNDVTERYFQKKDDQWARAKGFDTFAPIGPWIETELDPDNVQVETYLNGELRQRGHTSDLIFSAFRLLSFISGVMTLLPGDVIATGTPSGIGALKAGDTVEIKVEKIGTLKNYVVAAK